MVTMNSKRYRSARRGLSLVEAMISLSITSMLLVAVAAAFTGSSEAIQVNDTFFRCTQASRITMNQLLAEIRNCDSLDMSTANTIKIIRPASGGANQLYALQTNEISRAFVYDTAGKRITLQISYSGGTFSPVYELANNVTACQFGPPDMGLDYNNATIPIRVPITLSVSAGNNTIVLNGAAAPRRAMKY